MSDAQALVEIVNTVSAGCVSVFGLYFMYKIWTRGGK